MPVESILPSRFEISTHNPGNLIAVENEDGRVLVRAGYDNFSPRRKAFLIRQLAAEGYIPDAYEYFTEESAITGLLWVIDRSLISVGPEARRRSSLFMRRLLVGSCLLWLMELALLLKPR